MVWLGTIWVHSSKYDLVAGLLRVQASMHPAACSCSLDSFADHLCPQKLPQIDDCLLVPVRTQASAPRLVLYFERIYASSPSSGRFVPPAPKGTAPAITPSPPTHNPTTPPQTG